MHPADLGAHVINALVERNDARPARGRRRVLRLRRRHRPPGRRHRPHGWLAAGLPEEVPGTTIDRQCGSSQQAVHFAAQAVMSGTNDVIVAGGVQNMSMIPIASADDRRRAVRVHRPVLAARRAGDERYGDQEVSQFRGAELIAEKWAISREDMEAFAIESHLRALARHRGGPLRPRDRAARRRHADEGPREPDRREDGRRSAPLLEGGRLTAAVSSQISDAASAVLVARRDGGAARTG